jgi:DNA-binding transcriptional MerR regulator
MTDDERLTLEQLAGAVGMTTRNVRAYQTRGLLQPPRRVGRSTMYGAEHVERLRQVQRARARGASLQLLRTLIREGRDIDGVWSGEDAPQRTVVDVSDAALGHTPACLAHLDVPLQPLLEELGGADEPPVRPAVLALVERGVFSSAGDQVRSPGALACAAGALARQGRLTSAEAALRLTRMIAESAEAVAAAVVAEVAGLDPDARRAASERFGELAGAAVGEVVAARVSEGTPAPAG